MSLYVISITSKLALLLVIVSFVVSLPQASLAQQQPTKAIIKPRITSINFLTYSNPAFGIKMQYPSNWQKQDLSRMLVFPSNISSVVFVVFKIPAEKPFGFLSISALKYKSANVTLDTLVKARVKQISHTGNIHLNSSMPTTLSGNPAHKIVLKANTPQGAIEEMQLISIVGNRAYFINYAIPAAHYATYLPTIQTILSSTEINR